MTCEKHNWQPTGKHGNHVDFMYSNAQGQHKNCHVYAIYVKCQQCNQVGYRRTHSQVVYTWGPDK